MTSFGISSIARQLLYAMGPMEPDSDSSDIRAEIPPKVNTTSQPTNLPETDNEEILFKPRWEEPPQDPQADQSDTSSPLIDVIYLAKKSQQLTSPTQKNLEPSFPTPPSKNSSNKMMPISIEENSFKNPALEKALLEINAMAAENPDARRAFEAAAREHREGQSMSWGRQYMPHPRNLSVSEGTSNLTDTPDSAATSPTKSSSTRNTCKETKISSRLDLARGTDTRSPSNTKIDHCKPRNSQVKCRVDVPENTVTINQEFKCDGCNKVFEMEAELSTHCPHGLCPFAESNGKFYSCDGCRRTFKDTKELKRHHTLTGHDGEVSSRGRRQKDERVWASRSSRGNGTLYVPPEFCGKNVSKLNMPPAQRTGANYDKYRRHQGPQKVSVTNILERSGSVETKSCEIAPEISVPVEVEAVETSSLQDPESSEDPGFMAFWEEKLRRLERKKQSE
jgi:Zinc finger, C2H2 type